MLRKEELNWHQHSRSSCLKDGDGNIKFFHSKANGRAKANKIAHQLTDATNSMVFFSHRLITDNVLMAFELIHPQEKRTSKKKNELLA